MEYLVLRQIREYGVIYKKGDVIPEEKIRSVRLTQAHGKIIPAVSSQQIADEGELFSSSKQLKESVDIKLAEKVETPSPSKFSFNFNK